MYRKKTFILLGISLGLLICVVLLALNAKKWSQSWHDDQIVKPAPTQNTAPNTTQPANPQGSENSGEDETPLVTASDRFYDEQGEAHTLEEFDDKPVIVSLWSVNKSKSTQNLDFLEEAYQEYGDKVHFIVIHVSNDSAKKERAVERAREEGCTFPIYHDPDGAFLNQYDQKKVPLTIYFQKGLDPIAYTDVTLTEKALQTGLKAILPQ